LPSFIDRGAPLSTHLRTPIPTTLAGQNSLFQKVLAPLDPDLPVVNLDDTGGGALRQSTELWLGACLRDTILSYINNQ
jgi:hypothetical protein